MQATKVLIFYLSHPFVSEIMLFEKFKITYARQLCMSNCTVCSAGYFLPCKNNCVLEEILEINMTHVWMRLYCKDKSERGHRSILIDVD